MGTGGKACPRPSFAKDTRLLTGESHLAKIREEPGDKLVGESGVNDYFIMEPKREMEKGRWLTL